MRLALVPITVEAEEDEAEDGATSKPNRGIIKLS